MSVRNGPLFFKPKKNLIKKMKEHQACLYEDSEKGRSRLELYETKKDIGTATHALIVVGANIIKVQRLAGNSEGDHTRFLVSTIDQQQFIFGAQNEVDCKQWVETMQKILFRSSPPTARQGQGQSQSQSQSQGQGQGQPKATTDVTIDNDVYMPAEELSREFTVTMTPDTRLKLAAENPVRLLVENNNITVISRDGVRVVRWAIEQLRRLGYAENNFHLEAGRKSTCGPGNFTFVTAHGKRILALVDREKEAWRKLSTGRLGAPPLPPGQVSLPPQPPPLASGEATYPFIPTMGNHIYEEFVILKPPTSPTLKMRVKSFENDKAKPTTMMPPIKSLPTSSARPTNDSIYSEAVVEPNPWKKYGMNVADEDTDSVAMDTDVQSEESFYNNLSYHVPIPTNQASGESPYHVLNTKTPKGDAAAILETTRKKQNSKTDLHQTHQQQQQEEIQGVIVEPLYAQVNKSKKIKHKGPSVKS